MYQKRKYIIWHTALLTGLLILLSGCAQLRLPAIDPTGTNVFLPAPYSTTILPPGRNTNPNIQPYGVQPNTPFGTVPGAGQVTPSQTPLIPAFTQPATPPPCVNPNNGCYPGTRARKHIIPDTSQIKTRGEMGEIIMTPHRIIAPVGSEVVVLAGICGGDGFYVVNQPLEWMLSNNSVGQIVEVGGMEHPNFNRLVPPSAKKFDGQYAWGRTGLKEKRLTRGTPTPADDIDVLKGQTYVSLSSASPGTTYLTAVAPKAEGWDKRRSSTTIHWVDGIWSIPLPASATAGTVHPMTTFVRSATDEGGIPDWKVRYTIVGGAPAEFAPTGSQTVESVTGQDGLATVQIRQPAGQFEPGVTQVRVDVIRPPVKGERELLVESGITNVTWSAPALTIRAIGPQQAANNEAFNYRIEVTNPGDQIARDVIVRTNNLGDDVTFISSNPKPTQYGRDYEWKLGDINPGSGPRIIDVQLKSNQPGLLQLCFDVASEADQLKTQACGETEIVAPCIGLEVEGPETARVGDEILFNIQVVNQCEQALENVVLNLQFDPQLRPQGGMGPVIEAEVGRLEFGERKTIPIIFDVLQPGQPCFTLRVAADGGHTARARQCVSVEQVTTPEVTLQLDGQRLTEAGNRVVVRSRVTNTGTAVMNDVVLINKFSPSLEPKDITNTYQHNWLQDDLAIRIGRLGPGQEAVVEIVYEALQTDGNAFSEFSVSSPGGVSASDKFDIRIEAPGGGLPGGTQNNGIVEPNFGGQPNGAGNNPGRTQIPNDPNATGLSIKVEALDQSVVASPVGTPGNNVPQARFLVTVVNNSSMPEQNVDITLHVHPGLWLFGHDLERVGLGIVGSSQDKTQFQVQRRLEMRAGESIQFTAYVAGDQVGPGTFEVRATSDNTVGSVSDNATVEVVR